MFRRAYKGLFQIPVASPALEVERAEQIFYIKYIQEGMVVFDVGAHIGELTLLLSRFVGEKGQVHAFEACCETFGRLKTVCEFANRKNVILNHNAVTDDKGIANLYIYNDEHSGWNTLAERSLREYGIDVDPVGIEKVPAIRIDDYCERKGITQIDLLKVDVEGAEFQVICGASRMFQSRKVRCCVFEFGQTTFDMGNNPDDIESRFRQFGYEVQNIVEGDPIFPGRASAKRALFSVHVARPKT